MSKRSEWVKTDDCCYKELRLKGDRAPISDFETYK